MKPKSQIYAKYLSLVKPVSKIPIIKTYGSTVFTLITITFFIFYAIKPTIETILVLQQKLANSTEVLEKVNLKARNLSQGKTNLENMNQNIKIRINNLVPNTVNIKSIIQIFEQSAKSHEASISALQIQPVVIEPSTEEKVGTVSHVDFTFNTQGKYESLVSVLQDLRSSDRLISIDNISLSKTEDSGIVMSVSGKAYYIK